MFTIPWSLGLSCDIAAISLFLRDVERFPTTDLKPEDFKTTTFGLFLLASVRILFLLPLVVNKASRRKLRCPTVYKIELWVNIVLISAKGTFLLISANGLFTKHTFISRQWLVLYCSIASVAFQAMCLDHLRSSAPSNNYRRKRMAYSNVGIHQYSATPGYSTMKTTENDKQNVTNQINLNFSDSLYEEDAR